MSGHQHDASPLFISLCSAIISALFTNLFRNGPKPSSPHLEIKAMLRHCGRQRGAGLNRQPRGSPARAPAFHHLQRRHTVVIQHLLADKLLAPVGVFHLAASPRRSPDSWLAFYRAAIDVQRQRHTSSTTGRCRNGQQHLLNLLLRVAHQVNFRRFTASLYYQPDLIGIQGHTAADPSMRLGPADLPGLLQQSPWHFTSRGVMQRREVRYRPRLLPGASAPDCRHIALLINIPPRLLAGFQPTRPCLPPRWSRDQTKHQHHQQRFADAIVTFFSATRLPAYWPAPPDNRQRTKR